MLASNYHSPEGLIPLRGRAPWEADAGDTAHGFDWLDDLAAAGSKAARDRAQAWLQHWINTYDRPLRRNGPAWDITALASRQISLLTHAPFIMAGQDAPQRRAFFKLLARQTAYLAQRAPRAHPIATRLCAVAAWVYATSTLMGFEALRPKALRHLGRLCADIHAAPMASLPRNPARLVQILAQLIWLRAILGHSTGPEALHHAIRRCAGILRALQLPDGGLPRFHGCDGGDADFINDILARAEPAANAARMTQSVGFLTITCGSACLTLDAAPPPAQEPDAHASSLALEFSLGTTRFLTSCGSALGFAAEWQRAGRATPSHSTACLAGRSSAGLDGQYLIGGPTSVEQSIRPTENAERVALSHNAWQADYGLHHIRALTLSHDGTRLEGEDAFAPRTAQDHALFADRLAACGTEGLRFSVHFHLHPDVISQIDMGGRAASFVLPDGQVWILHPSPDIRLQLRPSVYFDPSHANPRATKQVVLFSALADYGGAIGWCFLRADMGLRHHAMD
ncbi:heparinase II/III family protein [Rhodobacteraceae bacterium XHP0102]|nr:heparinase II/III family protein [Rhodobacteraceae bacterium XHP0102]